MAITGTIGNSTVTIPDRWYVYSNQRIKVTTTGDTEITMTVGGISETRTFHAGACEFSLSPFLSVAPDVNARVIAGSGCYENNASGEVRVTFEIEGNTIALSVPYTLGAWVPASTYKRKRYEVYNAASPFEVNLRGNNGAVSISMDGAVEVSGTLGEYKNSMGMRYDMEALLDAVGESELPTREMVVKAANYDLVGDDEVEVTEEVHIIIEDAACGGVGVRWLDQYGRTRHRVMRLLQTEQSVSGDTYDTGAAVGFTGIDADSFSKGAGIFRNRMTTQRVITLGLPSQREELIEELMTLLASDFVEVENNPDEWLRVNVVDGSFTKTTKHLQDFSVQMRMQTEQSQTR